jgi:serine/threonine-protein kinase
MSGEDDLLGRVLAGRFTLTSVIGEGGMAKVYRGEQEGEPRAVAIKIMNPELALDAKFVKRFRREAKSAALLQHPSTVKIFDYGVEDGLPYIAMELLAGAELVAILDHEKRLSEMRAAKIIGEVLSALSMAHEQGIVHRDLKPENIMIVRPPDRPTTELVKVLDFGIAKIVNPDLHLPKDRSPDDPPPSSMGRTALTMMGTIVGTPEYMSPEQSRGGVIDARSDVYACGVLLFHLVTGKVPFQAALPFETAMLHVTTAPPKPSSIVPKIHPGLEALILRALAKDPADRPESARAMQETLLELLPDLSPTKLEDPEPESTLPAGPAQAPRAAAAPVAPTPVAPTRADTGSAAPLPTMSDEPRAAITQDDPAFALAKTMMMDESAPLLPPMPMVPALPVALKKESGLSAAASLFVGVGLGALVLALAAFLLLRR